MAFIVTGGCKGIVAWNSSTNSKKCKIVEINYDITRIAFVNNFVLGMSSDLHIYDATTMHAVGRVSGHTKSITSYFFKSSLLYTTGEDGMVFGWDLRGSRPAKSIQIGSPISSGIVYRDEIYLADYAGGIYRKDHLLGKRLSNCAVYLEKCEDDLVGYDAKGHMHKISVNSSNPHEGSCISVSPAYGTCCVAGGSLLAAGCSKGIGFVSGKRDEFMKVVEFVDTPGWVWDIQFASENKEVFYACSDGLLRKVSFNRDRGQEEYPQEQAMTFENTVVLSLEYPLKALGIQENQKMYY